MNVGLRKPAGLRPSRSASRARPARRTAASPRVERLEARTQLSSLGASPWPLELANDSLDRAVDLGDVGSTSEVRTHGSVGQGSEGAADVEWYSFRLDRPGQVTATLGRPPVGSSFRGALSLYNNDTDYTDPFNPHGHRRLDQAVAAAADGVATLDRVLGPGTYSLAVSGAGNLAFHPLVAGSGLPGSTGDFELRLDVADAGPAPGDGPAVLASEPASVAVLDGSPFVIRLALSGPLDPWSISPGQTVQLAFSPDETFGDEDDRALALASASFSVSAGEIQLIPAAPLAPGHYRVSLAGDGSSGLPVLTTPDGVPLAMDGDHPQGRDFSYTFRVAGIEGDTATGVGANDTPGTSRDLGTLTPAGLVQVGGAIGDDPFYNPAEAEDPFDSLYNPGTDVDLYHFRVVGPGRHAFVAEVFAGRIGSPLDPGLSLFRFDPETGSLHFLAGNNNTSNPVRSNDGQVYPLFSDSVLFESLEAGDYYLAVAGGFNTPSPLEYLPPGSPDLFDPTVSHSGRGGFSTGPYLLNLVVHPSPAPPRVLSTSWDGGARLDRPPTHLVVGFDHSVNLPFLAFRSFQETTESTVEAVYLLGADGTKFFPRFDAYDDATDRATFLLLDALPDGDYELHLSGSLGLTDLAGNPLVGNDPGGDYVVRFTVDGPERGHGGNPRAWVVEEPHDDLDHPQDLGVLFPRELEMGVTITRDSGPDSDDAPSDRADVTRFRVLQQQLYTLRLSSDGPLDAVTLTLRDASGQIVMLNELITPDGERVYTTYLDPGMYTLEVSGWAEDEAEDKDEDEAENEDAGLSYQVSLTLVGTQGNAPPLFSSPAPAVALRLDSVAPPPSTTPPSSVTPPGGIPPVLTPVPPPTPGGGTTAPGGFSPGGGPGSPPDPNSSAPSTPIAPGDPSTPLIDISSQPQVGGTAGSSSSTDLSALAFGPRGGEGSASASLDSTVIVQRGTPTSSPVASTGQGPAAPLPTSSDATARDAHSTSPLQQAVAILFTGTASGLILLPVEAQGVEGDEPRSAPPTAPGVYEERDAEVRAPETDGDLAATASAEARPGKSVVEVAAPPAATAVHAEGRPGESVVEVAAPASRAVDIEASSVVGVPEGPIAAASPSPEEDVAPDDGTPSLPAILSILGVVSIVAILCWRQLGRGGALGEGWRARAAAWASRAFGRVRSWATRLGLPSTRSGDGPRPASLVLKVDDLVSAAEPGR